VPPARQVDTAAALGRFRPYLAYKNSGVEWLGKIPAHWEVRALKRLGLMRSGTAITSEDIEPEGDFPVFGGNGIRGYAESYTHDGDFPLVGRQGALCGCVNFASGRFWASEHAVVVTPAERINAHWLTDLLAAMSLNQYSQSAAQPGLAVETIGAIRAPAPPLEEQCAIAAFLDRETARIDALVAKNERLVELLQEKRAALITRAVTKGLDPNVPMKDSGVEWLGEIPAHWEVKPLKYFLRAPLAYGVLKPDKYTDDDGVPLIRILDVESGQVREAALDQISPGQSAEFRRTLVREGDLVVSVVGTIGRAFVVPTSLEGANLSRALARVQLKPALGARFLEYGFDSSPFASFVELVPAGTAQRVLNLGDLAEYAIAAPPPSDQAAIVSYLDRETARIDVLVGTVRDAIDHLKELRTALISAAVTGKIDVREEV
jgi:type I restriction enzyme S subunit